MQAHYAAIRNEEHTDIGVRLDAFYPRFNKQIAEVHEWGVCI